MSQIDYADPYRDRRLHERGVHEHEKPTRIGAHTPACPRCGCKDGYRAKQIIGRLGCACSCHVDTTET